MTLESWSMGIVRPVMEIFPWAWAFFIPFIVIATFTILNLFIGIIVSTMQELASVDDRAPSPLKPDPATTEALIARIESHLAALRKKLQWIPKIILAKRRRMQGAIYVLVTSKDIACLAKRSRTA
jgi:voltage-gated sodium channel